MYDVIIKGGTVYDGTGKPGFIADVAIEGGKIAAIGDLSGKEASTVVDAKGKAVTPGFIDMHSHGDLTLPFYPDMESKLRQGITTILGGQCGLSLFPIDVWWESQYFEHLQLLELSDTMASPDYLIKAEKLSPLMKRDFGREIDWRTFPEFVDAVRKTGIGANYVPLVGHGTIRSQVLGKNFKRVATDDEIKQMCDRLEEIMKAGARGMSVGLDYAPGLYADYKELKALCEVLAKYDGIYDPHWRKTGPREGTPRRQKKILGVIESLKLGLDTGVQVHLAHLTCGYDVFPAHDDDMSVAAAKRTLRWINEYRDKGVRVTFDVIPNVTGGILDMPDLAGYFAKWIMECGSKELFCKRLKYSDYRAGIKAFINSGKYYGMNPVIDSDWSDSITILRHKNKAYEGRNVTELAEELGIEPIDLVLDLLRDDPETKTFSEVQNMNHESVRTFIGDPYGVIGSDTFAFDDKAILYSDRDKIVPPMYPNPNTYCGFIRYLKHYPQATFEATIKKVTGQPAEILGLKDRGALAEGKKADVLVIDCANLAPNENHIDPRVYPSGIDYVFVNGKAAICGGENTKVHSGEVILK